MDKYNCDIFKNILYKNEKKVVCIAKPLLCALKKKTWIIWDICILFKILYKFLKGPKHSIRNGYYYYYNLLLLPLLPNISGWERFLIVNFFPLCIYRKIRLRKWLKCLPIWTFLINLERFQLKISLRDLNQLFS